MIRFLCFLGLVVSSVFTVSSQSDTLFYDANWELTSREEAFFYRPKPLVVEGGFLVKDYYISGAMQMQGVTTSEMEEVWNGATTWYYPTGEVSQKTMYKAGVVEGNSSYYSKNGALLSSAEYRDGEPFAGSVWSTDEGADFMTFYDQGRKTKTEIVSNEPLSKAHCSVTFESESSYKISFYNQKGEFVGELSKTGEEKEQTNGVYAGYLYHPLIVEKVMIIKDGALINPLTYYYSDGKVKRKEYYEGETTLLKEIAFGQDGKLLDSLIYKDSDPYNGTKYEFFYPIGSSFEADKLERITKYVNGETVGTCTEFYLNGKKHTEKRYKLGELSEQLTYDTLGVVTSSATYKDGLPWEGTVFEAYNSSYTTYSQGVVMLEKRFHANGALEYKKDIKIEESYDTTGVCIAHLEYKDGAPFNGKSIYSYLGEISSLTEYKNGVITLSVSYTNGVESERTTYTETGELKERTEFFTTGKIKAVTKYRDGYESAVSYFTADGKPAGSLLIDSEGGYEGEKYSFDGDQISSYEQYKEGKVVRMRTYNSEGVLLSDVDYNGVATFYDVTSQKTYTCTYKDGEPFEGTHAIADEYNSGFSAFQSYKNGMLNGESLEYEYDYETGTHVPLTISYYVDGKLNGEMKQYKKGVLAATTTFLNDEQNGLATFYDMEGKMLATATYKDALPYSGVVYEFDYLHQVTSIVPYKNGAINGDANYFTDNVLDYTQTYSNNNIVKQVTYMDGAPKYTLIYKDGDKFEGQEYTSNTLYEYKNGVELMSIEYSDETMTVVIKKRVTMGAVVAETVYYTNGNLKSTITYSGYEKEGGARFYSPNGREIASGTYRADVPAMGSFAYFSVENEEAYLLVVLEAKQVVVSEFNGDKKLRTVRYDLLENEGEGLQSSEISSILTGLSSMFSAYEITEYQY